MRAAASRTFCTAGNKSPISTAMIAITTSSSINVKPPRPRGRARTMTGPPLKGGDDTPGAAPAPEADGTPRATSGPHRETGTHSFARARAKDIEQVYYSPGRKDASRFVLCPGDCKCVSTTGPACLRLTVPQRGARLAAGRRFSGGPLSPGRRAGTIGVVGIDPPRHTADLPSKESRLERVPLPPPPDPARLLTPDRRRRPGGRARGPQHP